MVIGNFEADAAAASGRDRASAGDIARQILTVRGASVNLFRLSHAVGSFAPPLGLILKQFNHMLTGADIAWQCSIGPGLVLFHPTGVVIGPTVRIGARCIIQQGATIGGSGGASRSYDEVAAPTIGDDVFVGAGARIFGPVKVGSHAKIGANAVVLKDVPAGASAVGVPAHHVKAHPQENL